MLKLKIFNTQKKKGSKRGQNFFVYDLVTGCFRRRTDSETSYVLQHVACLPVMRLWQPQRVVYVMAAETFHRRACCQIVCESKMKETKEKEVEWGKEQASKTVLNFCQGHCERAAQKSVSLFFIFNRNSKPRHSHKNVHTLVEILAVARPRPHAPHTPSCCWRARPAISVAKRQNRKMPPFPAPSSSQAASIIIIRQQNSATKPAN